ncbi:uncharacterized protein GGS25DRAFT_522079 [Hypoxylon fragiforme]|uniref:uncharacterized protein n=1 Tax=Hypoxylon fragiforme TaxID=63214 RepID=UPI0020C5E016|nr:uncharacterized protein GGS25DRAFT_522079 [Hypoxylon fragiforme]KAI2608900.1 hypothetical protein GGS25DRAFT_522079 [Hypoxylon fragiforme]
MTTETESPIRAIAMDALAIFFPCGHRFIEDVPKPPEFDKESRYNLSCPACVSHKCVSCGSDFSGDDTSCFKCFRFCYLEVVAINTLRTYKDPNIDAIFFEQGIIVAPDTKDETSFIANSTEDVRVGPGYVQFNGVENGDGDVWMIQNVKVHFSDVSDPETDKMTTKMDHTSMNEIV